MRKIIGCFCLMAVCKSSFAQLDINKGRIYTNLTIGGIINNVNNDVDIQNTKFDIIDRPPKGLDFGVQFGFQKKSFILEFGLSYQALWNNVTINHPQDQSISFKNNSANHFMQLYLMPRFILNKNDKHQFSIGAGVYLKPVLKDYDYNYIYYETRWDPKIGASNVLPIYAHTRRLNSDPQYGPIMNIQYTNTRSKYPWLVRFTYLFNGTIGAVPDNYITFFDVNNGRNVVGRYIYDLSRHYMMLQFGMNIFTYQKNKQGSLQQ